MMRTFLKCAGAVVMAAVWGGVAWGQPSISPGSGALPGGEVGVAYSQPLTATDIDPTCCTWNVTVGALPDGLSLGASGTTTTISGTPTASGLFSFTITA